MANNVENNEKPTFEDVKAFARETSEMGYLKYGQGRVNGELTLADYLSFLAQMRLAKGQNQQSLVSFDQLRDALGMHEPNDNILEALPDGAFPVYDYDNNMYIDSAVAPYIKGEKVDDIAFEQQTPIKNEDFEKMKEAFANVFNVRISTEKKPDKTQTGILQKVQNKVKYYFKKILYRSERLIKYQTTSYYKPFEPTPGDTEEQTALKQGQHNRNIINKYIDDVSRKIVVIGPSQAKYILASSKFNMKNSIEERKQFMNENVELFKNNKDKIQELAQTLFASEMVKTLPNTYASVRRELNQNLIYKACRIIASMPEDVKQNPAITEIVSKTVENNLINYIEKCGYDKDDLISDYNQLGQFPREKNSIEEIVFGRVEQKNLANVFQYSLTPYPANVIDLQDAKEVSAVDLKNEDSNYKFKSPANTLREDESTLNGAESQSHEPAETISPEPAKINVRQIDTDFLNKIRRNHNLKESESDIEEGEQRASEEKEQDQLGTNIERIGPAKTNVQKDTSNIIDNSVDTTKTTDEIQTQRSLNEYGLLHSSVQKGEEEKTSKSKRKNKKTLDQFSKKNQTSLDQFITNKNQTLLDQFFTEEDTTLKPAKNAEPTVEFEILNLPPCLKGNLEERIEDYLSKIARKTARNVVDQQKANSKNKEALKVMDQATELFCLITSSDELDKDLGNKKVKKLTEEGNLSKYSAEIAEELKNSIETKAKQIALDIKTSGDANIINCKTIPSVVNYWVDNLGGKELIVDYWDNRADSQSIAKKLAETKTFYSLFSNDIKFDLKETQKYLSTSIKNKEKNSGLEQ